MIFEHEVLKQESSKSNQEKQIFWLQSELSTIFYFFNLGIGNQIDTQKERKNNSLKMIFLRVSDISNSYKQKTFKLPAECIKNSLDI